MRGFKGKDVKALTRRAMRRAWAAARVLAREGDELLRLAGHDPDDPDGFSGDDFAERVFYSALSQQTLLSAFPVDVTGEE